MGTIGIRRAKGRTYKPEYVALPAQAAAKFTRSLPDKFIAKNGHDVTKAFFDYAKPLVGALPHCEIL
jgi:6-phosphofructokinase 1